VSAGNTRNMEELYPDSDMPYLSGVACYEDAQAPDYLSVLYLNQEITIEEKDSAGYVTKAQMNGKSYTGEELRGELGLKSANFNVTELEPGKIRIVTKGHGHGFGLSQYTAQKMAEEGDVVTLSPACASFDLYPNFEARGRHFKRLVNEL
jgi:stage II sporulation protein D